MELQFLITNTNLKRLDNNRIKSKNRIVQCKFHFDETWDNIEKFAIFKTDSGQAHREYLGVQGNDFTIPLPSEMQKCRYFTVSLYANDSFLTNEVIIYFFDDVTHYDRGRVRNHRHHHEHYDHEYVPGHRYRHEPEHGHKHDHWDPRNEKDIFVDIYEQIHSCFDAIEFHEQTLEFFANRELVYSVHIPFADETTVRAWMAEQDMKNISMNQALEQHTHSKSDITDFDETMSAELDTLLDALNEAINNL